MLSVTGLAGSPKKELLLIGWAACSRALDIVKPKSADVIPLVKVRAILPRNRQEDLA